MYAFEFHVRLDVSMSSYCVRIQVITCFDWNTLDWIPTYTYVQACMHACILVHIYMRTCTYIHATFSAWFVHIYCINLLTDWLLHTRRATHYVKCFHSWAQITPSKTNLNFQGLTMEPRMLDFAAELQTVWCCCGTAALYIFFTAPITTYVCSAKELPGTCTRWSLWLRLGPPCPNRLICVLFFNAAACFFLVFLGARLTQSFQHKQL